MYVNQSSVKRYLRNPGAIAANMFLWLSPKKQYEGKFIFVMGPPRCGTTLAQSILCANSHIDGWLNETQVFSYKDLTDRSRFAFIDSEILEESYESSNIVEFFVSLHKPFIDKGCIPIEKTPQHAKFFRYMNKYFPNAKFLVMVRDPRDAYASGLSGGNIPQCEQAKYYAEYWSACLKQPLEYTGDSLKFLRYEDLVLDPSKCIQETMRFLDLPFEDEQLSQSARKSNPRINEGRAFEKIGREIDGSSIGRYKKLSRPELDSFSLCVDYMKKFGYEV